MFNYSDRMQNISGNAIREIFKLLEKPEMISFAGGLPANDMLPVKDIAEITSEIMSEPDATKCLQYGATDGFNKLKAVAPQVLAKVGITGVAQNEILIISGGQQGIDLTFKTFINPGDVILVENPTYLAALHIAKTYQAKAIGVNADEGGILIDDLKEKIEKYNPKVLYLVPTFSNPTGRTLTEERRKEIARITAEKGVIVLEDDPYSQLRFTGKEVPAMKAFDQGGNVIYLTSFSKTVAPGMRCGIACGNAEILRKLTIGKQATDVHTCSLSQAIIARYIESGKYEKQLQNIKPVYREKYGLMEAAIAKYMPEEFKFTKPDGGLFIWSEMPEYLDSLHLFPDVCALNVAYVPGYSFYADEQTKNTFRLNFSNATAEQIDVGMKRLGDFFKQKIAKR